MATVVHHVPAQSTIGSASSVFAPPQRSNSPAVGGRRRVAAPPVKVQPVVVAPTPKISGDVFYGYEDLSKMCGRFIGALFSCPNVPMFANTGAATSCPPLAHFIAYAIHRTRLPEVVVFTALFLLARLKERFPAARGSSGHRLFISAFMIASKVVCDDTYSNKSWCIVGQSLYTLKEVNQMEREMCSYLEWILHVEAAELEAFTQRVKKEYGADCPAVPPQWVSSSVAIPQAVAVAVASTSAAAAAVMPAATSLVSPTEASRSQVVVPAQSYPSPRSSPPSPSHSSDSSPNSSSDECPTPPSTEDPTAIAQQPSITHGSSHIHPQPQTNDKAKPISSISDPSFAFAGPTVW